jgi:hypothetical protein
MGHLLNRSARGVAFGAEVLPLRKNAQLSPKISAQFQSYDLPPWSEFSPFRYLHAHSVSHRLDIVPLFVKMRRVGTVRQLVLTLL